MVTKTEPRRSGRPSRQQAEQLEDKILDTAAALFFDTGYGAASIEEIARRAGISKRTFYARYANKAEIFSAVVHRLIARLRPDTQATDQLFQGGSAEQILRRIAPIILHASLSPEGLALHRTVMAEATRFPELAMIMHEQSARAEAITRIASLLQNEKRSGPDPVFAAEQFLLMLTAGPQRRALGLGPPLPPSALDQWATNTVTLFLTGCPPS